MEETTEEVITYRMAYSGVFGRKRKSSSGAVLLHEGKEKLPLPGIQALVSAEIKKISPKLQLQSFHWNVAERVEKIITYPEGVVIREMSFGMGRADIVLRGVLDKQ